MRILGRVIGDVVALYGAAAGAISLLAATTSRRRVARLLPGSAILGHDGRVNLPYGARRSFFFPASASVAAETLLISWLLLVRRLTSSHQRPYGPRL